MKSIKSLLIAFQILLICVISRETIAQVASSPLFLGQNTYNPATVSLREESNAAFLYLNGSGKTETSGNSNETEEIQITRNALLLTLVRTDWSLEAVYDLKNENEIDNKTSSSSSVATSGNPYITEVKNYSIAVGLTFNEDLNWGLKYQSTEASVSDFDIVDTNQYLGAGVTYQAIKNLFLGLAGNYVMTKETGRVANNWLELSYGIGFLYEIQQDSILRAEFGIISSQEDIAEGSGEDDPHYHRATGDYTLNVEWSYQQLKLAYKNQTITISPLSDRSSESEDITSKASYGIAYQFESSNFFIEALKHNTERTRGDYTATSSDLFELRVGMVFGP